MTGPGRQGGGRTRSGRYGITLPAARGSQPMPARLQEAEIIPIDTGAALAVQLRQRVSYVGTFKI